MTKTFNAVVVVGAIFAIIAIILYAASIVGLLWMFGNEGYTEVAADTAKDAPKPIARWAALLQVVEVLGGLATVAAAAAGGFLIQEPLKKALRDRNHALEVENVKLQARLHEAT